MALPLRFLDEQHAVVLRAAPLSYTPPSGPERLAPSDDSRLNRFAILTRRDVDEAARKAMQEVMDSIRPGDLYRQIQGLTTQLERMALSKAPAPVKPRVNKAFNQ